MSDTQQAWTPAPWVLRDDSPNFERQSPAADQSSVLDPLTARMVTAVEEAIIEARLRTKMEIDLRRKVQAAIERRGGNIGLTPTRAESE